MYLSIASAPSAALTIGDGLTRVAGDVAAMRAHQVGIDTDQRSGKQATVQLDIAASLLYCLAQKSHDQAFMHVAETVAGHVRILAPFVIDPIVILLGHFSDRFAVFSDGIENLVLDHRERSAPAPFFERLLQPVATWEGTGRSRKLSRHLRDYLDSAKVCAATDDDKSLILGARL
jgi:hypothetical protein